MKDMLKRLIADEAGQAMTSNASFLAGCAVVGYGLWHYDGHQLVSFLDMVTNSLPPDGPTAGTTLR